MFKSALRLGPQINVNRHNRRRHYNQASEEQPQVVDSKNHHKLVRRTSKRYVDPWPKITPVSTGRCAILELPTEPLRTPQQTCSESLTCQFRALRAIDWLHGEQWQAGFSYLDETAKL